MDPNSTQNQYGVDGSQAQKYTYQYSTGSNAAQWKAQSVENHAVKNENYSNANYYHPPQPTAPATGNVQEIPAAPYTSSLTSGPVNVTQDYSGYTYKTSSDPHSYSNTGYSSYYSGYQQQQPSHSYPQPVGAYQTHVLLSLFPHFVIQDLMLGLQVIQELTTILLIIRLLEVTKVQTITTKLLDVTQIQITAIRLLLRVRETISTTPQTLIKTILLTLLTLILLKAVDGVELMGRLPSEFDLLQRQAQQVGLDSCGFV